MTPDELAGLRLRPAIRALVVDPADRVLLVRFEFTAATVWAPPGGGIEPGEDPIEALHRELAEEIGLVDAEIGPVLWERTHIVKMGRWDGQRDRVHLVRCAELDPEPQMGWDRLRAENVHELRWFSLDDLDAVPLGPRLRFAPLELAEIVRHVLVVGPPDEPFVVVNRPEG